MMLALLLLLLWSALAWADIDVDQEDDGLFTSADISNFITPTAGTYMGWLKVIEDVVTSGSDCAVSTTLLRDGEAWTGLGRSGANFCASFYDGSPHELSTPASLGWHHLALAWGGGTLTLYVDGVAAASTAVGALIAGTGANLELGRRGGSRLSTVHVYSTDVGAAYISAMARSRLTTIGSLAPTGYWPLDDCGDGANGDGATLHDRSGGNWPATANNGDDNLGTTCRASDYLRRKPWVQ